MHLHTCILIRRPEHSAAVSVLKSVCECSIQNPGFADPSCVRPLCLDSSGLDMVGRLLYAQVASASSSASNNRRSSAPVLAMLPTLAPEPLSLLPFPELPYLFAVGQNRRYHDHRRHQQSADTFHVPRAGTEASSRPLNQNTVTSLVSQARMHSQPNM